MYIKKIVQLLFILIAIPFAMNAQVTTGSISGSVKALAGGAVLTGATVEAKHEPTGTIYTAVARKDGRFDISNINGGGPYTIKATFVGFETETKEDVFITIGETQNFYFTLKDGKTQQTTVTVTGTRTSTAARNGSETTIGRDRLNNAPSVGRNLSDFVKFTPQVKITGDGGISIAGQNNRFNSFSIDGATNNDVFGLSTTGTNGGQAGTPPISLDAIDQIVVKISDFDASIGNFTGGAINAITRGGTNNISGSVYGYFRNQSTTGRAPVQSLVPGSLTKYEYAKAVEFKNRTIGFRIGGPIIKNKVFFFLNAEKQKDERPQPFDASSYRGSALGDGSLNNLVNYLKTTYNYDPGQYGTNPDLIDRLNINTRFDWNVDSKNKVTASYRYTNVERINPGRSSAGAIQFYNGAQLFPSVTQSGSIELNSKFSNKSNNKLRFTFTNVVDDRGFTGNPFPSVQIFDGPANIFFGSEAASTANLLKQNIVNLFDVYKKYLGKHSLSAGFDVDFNKTYNLFINRGFGAYVFSNVDSFIQNKTPNRYRTGFSLVDGGKAGDAATNSAAQFNSARLGLFINDDIKVTDDLTISLGLRADRFQFLDNSPVDQFWRDSASAKIVAAGYDLEGAQAGKLPNARFMFSPRFGFKYNVPEEGFTFRGGVGIFTGRTPLVWPGGVYQNTGITIGGVDVNNATQLYNLGVKFNPNVNQQPTNSTLFGGNVLPSGDLNLIAKDYRVPMSLRTTLAADKKLGSGWTFTVEGTFSKNIYETDWQNLAINKTNAVSAGPGTRDIITSGNTQIPLRTSGNTKPYTGIYLIRNTPSKTGYSYNFTAQFDKAWANNWAFNLAYNYGSSFVNNEGTSSVNASNWQFIEKVGNRNSMVRSVSDFSVGHRILTYASKKFNYAKGKLATTISLVYTGQSGNPISYVQSGGLVNDGVLGNDLVYVPSSRAELDQIIPSTYNFKNAAGTLLLNQANNLSSNGVTYTPVQQRDLFWEFIEGSKYLRSRKGQFAERNGGRTPFTNQVDLKIAQDFNVKVGGKVRSIQVGLDMFNFTNFLNSEWGRQYFAGNDQLTVLTLTALNLDAVTGNPTTTPVYRFSPFATPKNPINFSDGVTPFNNSRWTGQVSVRLNF
jgi:Carboxypeptidase regulatory-like domain